ncbi:MAG: TonB-dependent receptor [Acidobacteriia bacterium]|nr:TonB-dependent receptor [Terriglobia bacterium]
MKSIAVGRCLLLAVFLAAATAPIAKAQGTQIEGVVRDATGAVVPGAKVELRAKSYSSQKTTDASGGYAFDNVPETTGTIAVSIGGFQRVEQAWTASGGTPVRVDVVLRPSPVSERILVTAARAPTRLNETPLSDIQLTRDDLKATPALTLDDSLRQVPGFSLFRRSSSRTANPSTLGVSLRGLGGTATSRVLVLQDGIPLNDPFGSWVYWDRVPAESVSSIEVAQEGASSLYGSSALSGVVQFLTRPAHPAGISLETSYGNQNTPDLSLWAGGEKGGWESTVGGEVFHTDGYFIVPGADRGSVDTRARSKHGTADLMIGRKFGEQNEIFARGWYLDDSRNNGTVAQTNDVRLGQGALGANLQLADIGSLKLRFYGVVETYHQTFSAVAAGRNSEILTDQQTVPAQGVGGSALWTRTLGKRQTLVAGFDAHEEIGHTNEILFSGATGSHTKDTFSGGHQRTIGVFGEDMIQIAPGWLLSLSARFDHWRNFDAFSRCVPFALSCTPPLTLYADRSYDAFSPRATLIHQFNSNISWSASVYRAFRGPTLNELYRSFRQGNNVTNGNPDLRAERLTGGEAGIDVIGLDRRLEVRGVFFFNEVIGPIANVTCNLGDPSPCPSVLPPGVITRVKENLGRTSAPGFEIDGVAHITNRLDLSAGYQYVNATVISFPANTALVGLWVPQVPHNILTFQARYSNPSVISFALTGRMAGRQFDDDQNSFTLGNFFVLDAMASRTIGGGAEVFVSAENLFNERYTTGFASTSPVVPQLGLPIVARFGFRFQFPKR